MRPLISVITPWLDHPEFIADFETSVRHPGVEVVVIDNGSSSANAPLIRQMVERLGGVYLRNERNCWFSAANNQGLAAAQGKIALFLNNDTVGHVGWLDQVGRDVKGDALFGPSIMQVTVEGRHCPYVEGWCIAAERAVWDRLDGWDADAYAMPFMEDTDLGLRAQRLGIVLRHARWPIQHKRHGTASKVPGAFAALDHNLAVFAARVRGDVAVMTAQTSKKNLAAAIELLANGRLPEAEIVLEAVIREDPRNADAWARYAHVLHASGRDEAVIAAMLSLTSLKGEDAAIWSELALLLARHRRHEEASAAFAQVVRLMPLNAEPLLNLSKSLLSAGNAVGAADAARRAIALDPSNAIAYLRLGQALLGCNELKDAAAAAQHSLRLNPQSAAAQKVLNSVRGSS